MTIEQLTPRVKHVSDYCAEFQRHVYILDGVEVLHACKTYYYDSAPYYSRVNSCGEYIPQISKDEFNNELQRIMSLS